MIKDPVEPRCISLMFDGYIIIIVIIIMDQETILWKLRGVTFLIKIRSPAKLHCERELSVREGVCDLWPGASTAVIVTVQYNLYVYICRRMRPRENGRVLSLSFSKSAGTTKYYARLPCTYLTFSDGEFRIITITRYDINKRLRCVLSVYYVR